MLAAVRVRPPEGWMGICNVAWILPTITISGDAASACAVPTEKMAWSNVVAASTASSESHRTDIVIHGTIQSAIGYQHGTVFKAHCAAKGPTR